MCGMYRSEVSRQPKTTVTNMQTDDVRRKSTSSLNMHRPYGLCMPVHRCAIHVLQRSLHPKKLHHQTSIECVIDLVIAYSQHSLTLMLVSQGWQKKACSVPVRDTGPRTRRIGTALIVIAFVLIVVRFSARWSIRDSSIGWDDWTILLAFIGLVPSTAIAQVSESQLSSTLSTALIYWP